MDEVESEFLKNLVCFRYIDDIVFIWTHGKEHLETFLQELSNFIPDLNFTYESDDKEISFLNLQVKLNEGKIRTCCYIKYTNRHQYLHFASSHLNHTKRSVVYSRGLRVKRLSSAKEDILKHMQEMKSRFLKRSYPEDIVEQKLGNVEFSKLS